MPEITLSGANAISYPQLATWNSEVALYLFLGGLVAGLMVLSSAIRLLRVQPFARALLVADLAALPLLGVGMFMLWLDLANRWNVWRFFVTLQPTSVMSWGSWILLLTMGVLAVRLLSHADELPAPRPLLPNGKRSGKADTSLARRARLAYRSLWRRGVALARTIQRADQTLAVVALVLGVGIGVYTGMLLSTIAARPLWSSAALPLLFLTSGVASGGAFLMLFVDEEARARLIPSSVALGVGELLLIGAYLATLLLGSAAMQRASGLLFAGSFGLWFWGSVVLLGLLVPIVLEVFEWQRNPLPGIGAQTPPVLKLIGGATLRFVIVSAGLLSFI